MTALIPRIGGRVGDWRVPLRLVLLGIGGGAELLWLTISCDSPRAAASDPWWARLAANAPIFVSVGIAFVGAFVLLLVPRLKGTLAEAARSAASHSWQGWLIAHLASFVVLYIAVKATFGATGIASELSGNWFSACVGFGILWLLTWLLTFEPLSFWFALIRTERWSLLIAAIAAPAAWLGGQVARRFWEPLAAASFSLSEQILSLLYPDVVSDASDGLLGTSRFSVGIAPQCSGYEGIGLVTVFLAVYLWLFRDRLRFPQALFLLPAGIAASWLANILRITALIAMGTSFSRNVAAGGFHSQAGWIAFLAIALGIVAITHKLQLFGVRETAQDRRELNPIAKAMLVPLLVLMASGMLTTTFSADVDWLYGVRVLTTAAVLFAFRRIYAVWDWSWSVQSVLIGAAVFVFWVWLEPAVDSTGPDLGAALASVNPGIAGVWIAFRVIGSVLVVPVAEELAFRGYLIRKLIAADFENVRPGQFTWTSFIVSSLAFGLLHGRWFAGTLAGMAYALALYRRGHLGDAVAAHITTNGLIAVSVLIMGKWSLWA